MAGKGRGKGRNKAKGEKRKHPLTPPSEDFGDSELSSEWDHPPSLSSPSSICMDDSMGLSPRERAYLSGLERADLDDSGESKEGFEEEDEEKNEGEDKGYDGGDEGGAGDKVGSDGGKDGSGGGVRSGGGGGNGDNSSEGSGDGGGDGSGAKGGVAHCCCSGCSTSRGRG